MKTKKSFFILLVIICISGNSCKSNPEVWYANQMKANNMPFNKNWNKKLISQKEHIIDYWIKYDATFFNPEFKTMNYDEIKNTKMYLAECYRIEYDSLAKYGFLKPFQSLMHLCKDTAFLHVFPNGSINTWVSQMRYKEGQWHTYRYCPSLLPEQRKEELFDKLKLPIFNIRVVTNTGYDLYYNVYIDNQGNFISIGGRDEMAFKTRLIIDFNIK